MLYLFKLLNLSSIHVFKMIFSNVFRATKRMPVKLMARSTHFAIRVTSFGHDEAEIILQLGSGAVAKNLVQTKKNFSKVILMVISQVLTGELTIMSYSVDLNQMLR